MSKKESGYYWLKDGIEEPTLTYRYKYKDIWVYGFNTADGGGLLPEEDLTENTVIIKAKIEAV